MMLTENVLSTSATKHWLSFRALLCVALVALPVLLITDFINPDWLGYKILYEQEGGWLADQGRDPLFVALVGAGRAVFGEDGYSSFRFALAVYFLGFSYLLCIGRVLPISQTVSSFTSIAIALLMFATTRFSVQIREGVAMTVALYALAPLLRTGALPLRSWFLVVVSSLIHVGTGLFLTAILMSYGLARGGILAVQRPQRMQGWWFGAFLTGGLLALIVLKIGNTGELVDSLFGDRESTDASALSKIAYWTGMGVVCFLSARGACRAYNTPLDSLRLRIFVRILASVLLPAIYGMTVMQLLSSGPPVMISDTTRAMQMVIGTLILLISLRRRLSLPLAATSLLLIADQLRAIYESLTTTLVLISG